MFHLYELLMFFLRHPRDEYDEEFLGPNFLHFYDKNYYRKDIIIKNRRGEKLKCCHFTPFNYNENTPCVIYTHSTSSCQLETLDILHILLICDCSIFSYDCAGCGLSDGFYSTKGWNESQDLYLILNHLRNIEKIKNFVLWGKYSGAVSSIITAALDGNIKLLILDSPYVSLTELYKTTFHLNAKGKREIIFKNICLYFARKEIKKKFHYDINNVCPIFFIENITTPTIYIISKNDKIVHPAHSLYLAYKQKRANKTIYISEKTVQSYESFSYENKLTVAIKSILYDSSFESDTRTVFDESAYSKLFNGLKDKYSYEFNFIDKLITKKQKQKKKIIDNVKRFICFKYKTQSSLNSSNCLYQSTLCSMRDINPNENEFMRYESADNIKYENYKNEKSIGTKIINEYEDLFPDVENIINESNEINLLKSSDNGNLIKLNQTYKEIDGEKNQKHFKILHMQSARSSLKSNKNTYKKSLTWDSKLHSSITYFKEDCPFELMKNE
ncbi:alpha/beta-hydrolase, putative [Plasmodium gallinaceum]|uniref:Alpha/beta-hydrolase, putative n=1 Tax=Plasmodium gallinaceum TaxID=5849 RepID=A0A1J1GM81_PLAGA|nr:alpha/beta-hydrolase, putative [Plasmodium gallinaceum]CRG93460.1 alpha/beta-hydrolase, putative [Plasmodium gallinaceum]